ncbi:unnamed protein product [Dracunculus medinensis]|uniref:triacylglycerol lipase n=1 Tax=Dracunculus medinensis TaxID=318479 RepID=A0A0N4UQG1_DRAME|nr:unnamed protein product [Dracunculus medinensis]
MVSHRPFCKYSLSFAGCGFLCVYHTGVCAALKEYAPRLLENVLCGASAGSLIAAAVACGICMSKATSVLLHVVVQARSVILGAFNNDFDLMRIIEKDLQALLPDNAHELCSGRVRISLTRVEDLKNVVISEYHSKEDLIQAIICSCFIPVYAGFYYPQFRGETYIDGGVTDNQPSYGENTLTVSPFSGEADICPRDEESASMLNLNFGGTSIRFTTNNLQRFMFCLFPPSPDVCSQICRQGFSDTLRFLVNNGFLSEGEEQIRVYKNHGVADFLSRSKIGHLFPIIMENGKLP